MSNRLGMNRIVCSKEGRQEICNKPSTAVESYPIYYGCGIYGRDHDIPTSQALSNGVVLHYTPKNDHIKTKPASSSRPIKTSTQSKPQQPLTSRELQGRVKGTQKMSMPAGLPAAPEVIVSHGGRHGIQSEAMKQFCSGIARRFPVLAFQKDREDLEDKVVNRTASFSYLWLMNDTSGKAMGGRSRGARCAAQASVYSSNKNLILWSYPFVRNYDVRNQELLALSSDTRALFIKGTKDWMGPEVVFGPLRREMKAKTWCIYVQDMDHNFQCLSDLEEQKICNAIGTIAGIWLNGDPENSNTPWNPEDGTEMGMAWDAERQEVAWTEWRPLGDKPPQTDVVKHDVASIR